MYLYLYFKYFFGWLLVLVLKILLQSILPNTGLGHTDNRIWVSPGWTDNSTYLELWLGLALGPLRTVIFTPILMIRKRWCKRNLSTRE